MPVYEYECNGCHHTFEKLVRMSQTSGIECPECGGQDLHRLMSTFGFAGAGIKSQSSVEGSSSCGSCSTHSCSTCGCH